MTTNGPNGVGHFDPSTYPPFPDDVPSVRLETFSLAALETGDPALQDKLFETCKTRGFFYLDLRGSSKASSMQADCDDIARLAEKVFQLPQEEKDKYPMKDSIFGFKPVGATKTDRHGTPDTASFFNISKDAILNASPRWPLPAVVRAQQALLARYMRNAHATGLTLLSILAAKLGLAPPDLLARFHRLGEDAGDHVRLTWGPPRKAAAQEQGQIQTPGHTDFGSITILFNWLGGLQVWSDPARGGSFENIVDPPAARGEDAAGKNDDDDDDDDDDATTRAPPPRWLWVRPPPPNHAVVNLGDAVVKWTGGALCSGRHRVVPAPGAQGRFDRYSVVYFVRPEDRAVLRRLEAPGIPRWGEGEEAEEEEEGITGKEWILKQARALGTSIAN